MYVVNLRLNSTTMKQFRWVLVVSLTVFYFVNESFAQVANNGLIASNCRCSNSFCITRCTAMPNVAMPDCARCPGSSCTLTCSSQTLAVGRSCCTRWGQWMINSPTCSNTGNGNGNIGLRPSATCPAIYPPQNGLSSGTCGPNAPAGTSCNFRCNAGFTLQGYQVVTCQPNGQWNAQTPLCISNGGGGGGGAGGRQTCYALDAPNNGFRRGSCQEGVAPNSVCSFGCNNGFTLRGSPQLVCQNNGNWNGQPPVCSPTSGGTGVAATCYALDAPENGGKSGQCAEGSQPQSVCRFFCNPGFRLSGQASLTCLNSGEWTGQEPTCVAGNRDAGGSGYTGQCPPLSTPINGVVTCVNDRCTFSCNQGYSLTGYKTVICRNGQWSRQPPVCSPLGANRRTYN